MPMIEAELGDLNNSKRFVSLDFCSGYCYPVHLCSYNPCRITDNQGAFISTCVIHELKNAAPFFQSTIPPLIYSSKIAVKARIGGFVIYVESEDDLLYHLDEFFTTCAKFNLILFAREFELYAKKVKWFGCMIDSGRYQPDPHIIEAIKRLDTPVNAA